MVFTFVREILLVPLETDRLEWLIGLRGQGLVYLLQAWGHLGVDCLSFDLVAFRAGRSFAGPSVLIGLLEERTVCVVRGHVSNMMPARRWQSVEMSK